MQNLPDKLYNVASVVQLEQIAIHQYGIPAYELMKRAGNAIFNIVKTRFSLDKKILVLCGAGNNAGDGYVVARLAMQHGFQVSVVSLIDLEKLKNEALLAYRDWSAISENEVADITIIDKVDLVIDALLGTGLTRAVSADWEKWIVAVNQSSCQVISVDIPSGLLADTGVIASDNDTGEKGVAIKADTTISFIGLKQGMFTAQAKDFCGEILFDDLQIPHEIYSQVKTDIRLIKQTNYALLPKRNASSHKGCFGHVLIVGGNRGMPGAVILAATAALRSGAGLVTIVTIAENLAAISAAVPEAMINTCEAHNAADVFSSAAMNDITHVAVGMGLGQDDWSCAVLQQCVQINKPLLVDADGLNLLAKKNYDIDFPLVITPHPGEAARLLSQQQIYNTADVQSNRFDVIKKLHALFSTREPCVVVLKGSGSLVYDGDILKVCDMGSAAMAAPGMGDVLSGILVGLMAQNIRLSDAAELAVCLHAAAAENIIKDKTRGLLASDVVKALPEVLQ